MCRRFSTQGRTLQFFLVQPPLIVLQEAAFDLVGAHRTVGHARLLSWHPRP